jgi:hypothetical protein
MAITKARQLAELIANSLVDSDEISTGAVTTSKLADTLDFSSKTMVMADDQLSGDKIHGGTVSAFSSTGIDDNASSTAVTILSGGNVGIGATVPDGKLTVALENSNTPAFRLSSPTSGTDFAISSYNDANGTYVSMGVNHLFNVLGNDAVMDTNDKSAAIVLDGRNNGRIQFLTNSSGIATSRMTILQDGNVGIGNATPENALHVSSAGDAQLLVQNTSTGDASIKFNRSGQTFFMGIESSDNSFRISDTGTGVGDGDRLIIDTSGNPTFTGTAHTSLQVRSADLSTVAFLQTVQGTDIRMGGSTNHPVDLYSNGTRRVRITSTGNVGINTETPTGYFHISGNGLTNDRMFNISTGGVGGGQTGIFYGGKVQVQANNNATENFGWHVYTEHAGIHSPTTSIYGEVRTGSSLVRALGVHGIAQSNSAAVNYGPNTANAQGVVAGVYAEAKTTNTTNNATTTALIAQNRSAYANTAYGAYINTTPGPTSIVPLSVNHNGTEKFTVNALADAMVHIKGDTADTGTAGGSQGLSIATAGGTSCPIYFGSETNSAQKSMYMTGYWIYLRGHQNEGIRFVFSQGGGTAPRSDQYQFKYNSAYRPTGNTTWDGFSDSRAKENVTNLTGALDTISQLRPVTFDWTDDYADTMNMFEMDTTDEKSYNHFSVKENGYDLDRKTSQIGFIAQEFEEVFPKSITETEMQLGDTKVEDFKTVNYDHLIPMLTKAIQELKAENDALKARVEVLEG